MARLNRGADAMWKRARSPLRTDPAPPPWHVTASARTPSSSTRAPGAATSNSASPDAPPPPDVPRPPDLQPRVPPAPAAANVPETGSGGGRHHRPRSHAGEHPRIAETVVRSLLPRSLAKAAPHREPGGPDKHRCREGGPVATIARENARRLCPGRVGTEHSRTANNLLAPLMNDTGPRLGPVSLQDVGRAGLEIAPPALAYGIGETAGADENEKKQLAITGLMGTAAISHKISRGGLRRTRG